MELRLVPLLLAAAAAGCLDYDSDDELRQINVEGQYYVFPLAYGSWSSAGPVAHTVRIVLEDVMHVAVQLNRFPSSTDLLKQTLGCTDVDANPRSGTSAQDRCEEGNQDPPLRSWASVEVWPTTGENKRLRRLLGTGHAMGYQTYPGLYTQKHVVKDGLAGQVLLRWWESYSLGAQRFFDTVQELSDAMTNLSFAHEHCNGGWCPPGTIRPMCDPDDADSQAAMDEMGNLSRQCSNGWFYSEACMNQSLDCIPVVLGEYNWNFRDWVTALQQVPVAVTWVGWWEETQMVKRLPYSRFLFYWWQPDPTFLTLESGHPEQVYFDHRSLSFDQIVNSQLVTWSRLREYMPEIADFLRNVQMSELQLHDMMQAKSRGAFDEDIACDWLRNNTAVWKSWIPRSMDTNGLPDFILGIVAASVVIVMVATAYGSIRSWRQYRDAPGNHHTETGAWTMKWIGPHVQARLKVTSTGYEKCRLKRNWVVNATPFDLTMCQSTSLVVKRINLAAYTYGQNFYCISEDVELEINKPGMPPAAWNHETEAITLTVAASDWMTTAPEGAVSYHGPCARIALGPDMGHIRLATLGHIKKTRCMVLCWSPPHILRGVPMLELAHFFRRVVTHPRLRDHWQEDDMAQDVSWQDAGPPVAVVLTRGSSKATKHAEHASSLHNSSANMYNALSHVIVPESSVFDASYAELHAKYGAANLFVSHVWAETAQTSLEAVRRLYRFVRENQLQSQQVRAWFCTVCNNQSRVTEELGSEVRKSPFYKVLQSKSIEQVALVSPLKALNRKWCNFEFSLAIHGDKPVWMVTSDGVVQAGDVPPKALRQIAEAVISFRCKESRCSTAADEAMIDAAVAEMGGYDLLDCNLKAVFRSAIEVAHGQLNEAFEMVKREEIEIDQSMVTAV